MITSILLENLAASQRTEKDFSRRKSVCMVGVTVGLLLTNGLSAFAQSSPQPAQDGMLKNGPPAWDANRDGVFTCDEWKSYADRLFSSSDRNRDGKLDPTEFAIVQKADATLAGMARWSRNTELSLSSTVSPGIARGFLPEGSEVSCGGDRSREPSA
jgi:hypothetical protein